MKTTPRILCFLISLLFASVSQAATILAGPVITHLSAREARIWIQWEEAPQNAVIRYSNQAEPDKTFESSIQVGDFGISDTSLDRVNPGRTYVYSVEADGETLVEELFTAPFHYKDIQQPPSFSVAIIGNNYVIEEGAEPPYQVLGGNHDVFPRLEGQNLSGVIWAGSTSFLRDMDVSSMGGILRRHGVNRAQPATRKLFANVWHKAVPGLGNFSAEHSIPSYAPDVWARAGFSQYWPSASNFHLKPHAETPLYHSFRWADTEFFFLDTYSERQGYAERAIVPRLFSEEQQAWLLRALSRSDAAFKVIVSGTAMLVPADNPGNFTYADQHKDPFMRLLERNRLSGLVFISGGKHFGEITKFVRPRGYSLYEMSVGSTTYLDPNNPSESNFFREPRAYSEAPQYGQLSVSGEEGSRVLTLSLRETSGALIIEHVITQDDVAWKESAF
ncbi:MAG: hypothetical protein ACPGN3_14265 [Opitutales bacterium]